MNKVLLLEHEQSKRDSDFRLMRLVEWAGFKLSDFSRATVTAQQPAPWDSHPPLVMLTLGPYAMAAAGLNGNLNDLRGYIAPGNGFHIIPTASPEFIQSGQGKASAYFINDLQKAVRLAKDGLPPQVTHYVLDPSPMVAYEWAKVFRRKLIENPQLKLAFDIETPGKAADEAELNTDPDAPDRTWHIDRIGFSYQGLTALSIPWCPEHMATIRMLLETDSPKVAWNNSFDVPRVCRKGVQIGGIIHDGMVMFHILHSDLPKSLKFVATFTCPWQPAWKHLSGARPAFYNASDADIEWRAVETIEAELKRVGLWHVYEQDVIELDPILVHMQTIGMPVNADVRLDRAIKLANKLAIVHAQMDACIPEGARVITKIFKGTPKDALTNPQLRTRPSTRLVRTCAQCGARKPTKSHTKRFIKKSNPCADAGTQEAREDFTEYYGVSRFKPSGSQLTAYHRWLKRPLPMVYDKKTHKRRVSFGEEQLRTLMLKYSDDKLYATILDYRGLDKLAGSYVGRPCE